MGDDEVRITIMGSGGVGKSALVLRLFSDKFDDTYDPTIEDFYKQPLEVDGKSEMIAVLDTAGQDEFSALQDQWIREGQGILLVYSLDQMKSLDKLKDVFEKICEVKDMDQHDTDDPNRTPIAIACNKDDLPESMKVLKPSEGEDVAAEWSVKQFRTSAKTGKNVKEIFLHLVREVLKKRQQGTKTNQSQACCTIL